MTREERNAFLKEMALLRKKREQEAEAETNDRKPSGRQDDTQGGWSDFQKGAAAAIAQLRQTDQPTLSRTVIADDRSRADKTSEKILRESESIEDRWKREKEEQKAENLERYENSPAGKLVTGSVDYKRWNWVKGGLDEAHGKEALAADHFHRVVLDRGDKDYELDVAFRHRNGERLSVVAEDFDKRYEAWRTERIEEGIKEGFLSRDEDGRVSKVHRERDRPGEKIVTRRTRGMEGRG